MTSWPRRWTCSPASPAPGSTSTAMLVVQNTYRAASALRARLEATALARDDLTWASFTMLFCLWVWGPAETRRLAERMGVARPTVSGVTDTLERRGLVERRRARGRPRACARWRLTRTRRATTFDRTVPALQPAGAAACSGLEPDEAASSHACCAKLVQSARRRGDESMAVDLTDGDRARAPASSSSPGCATTAARCGSAASGSATSRRTRCSGGAARALAALVRLAARACRRRALCRRPTTGQPVNVSHLQPRSREDSVRRRVGDPRDAALPRRPDGPLARLPQRDVRAVRGARRRVGAGAATSAAPRTSCATTS